MFEDSESVVLSVVVSDGNFENLFHNFVNSIKQTSFKKNRQTLAIFVKNELERSALEKYIYFLSNKLIYVNNLEDIHQALLEYLGNPQIKYVNILCGRISLRADAIDLLTSFLENNDSIDGAYSDYILSIDKEIEFEVVESNFATNFPFKLKQIPKHSRLLPYILITKKEVLIEFLNSFGLYSSFNFHNLVNYCVEKEFAFEKLDAILGSKSIYLKLDESSKNLEVPFKEKWQLEKLQQVYGINSVRLLFSTEITNLPYHFSNPFNNLVSVVVMEERYGNPLEKKMTIDSLLFQSYQNIEIIECACDVENDVVARNLFSLIAAGRFVFFVYAGDEVLPNAFAVLTRIMLENGSIGYTYFDYLQEKEQRVVRNLDFSFEKLKRFNYVPYYIFFNREVFLKGNFFEESLPFGYSLWEFLLRIGEKGIFGARFPEPLMKVNKTKNIVESKNVILDARYKAKIVLLHKELFTEMQYNWAKLLDSNVSNFDITKIPPGIIPNNALLAKVIVDKLEQNPMAKPKKILFVMYGWSETGGGTIFPRNVATELAKRGWKVSVFYASLKYDPAMPLYSVETHQELGVSLYGLYNRPAAFNDPENPERETSDYMVEQRFREVVEEVEPDIIHIHNLHGLCLSLPKIAKEKYKIPIVFTPHNYFLIDPQLYMINSDMSLWSDTDFFNNSELARKFPEKRLAYEHRQEFSKQIIREYFDLVLAVSRRQKEILADFVGEDSNMVVVHQANVIVDNLWKDEKLKIEARRKVPKKMRFGFIGAVFPIKGVHNIAKAAQYFLPTDVEFHIYGFVGQKYAELLNALDKKRMLVYHQEYSYDDLPQIASNIDVGMIPTIMEEPAPLVILEMNAMRLPVLGSKIGGIPDFIVDGVNGFLFEYDDIDSLVSAIQYCLLNPNVVEEMRSHLEPIHFFSDYVSHIEKLYSSLIERRFVNPRDFELIITHKLLSKKRISDITFTRRVETPQDFKSNFSILGYELLNLKLLEDSKDFTIYQAEFKVPKEVTIEEFFEETQKTTTAQTFDQSQIEEAPILETDLVDQKEDKVFELSDLEELLSVKQVNFEPREEESKQKTFIFETEEEMQEYEPELNVVWEGSQFVYHSLALINREHCSNLIDTNLVEVTIVPYETEQFQPIGNPKYEKLAKKDIRIKEEPPDWVKRLPYIWIRHQWPPKAEPPKGAKWVIMQPWEFTTLPKRFADIFLQADELWVPSNYTRQAFINSGIPLNKVQIVPNGVDPKLFQPNGEKYPLQTEKKLKFLFVGGTTYRKGFDVLLQSYVGAFTAKDDVALVVKDMGTESFYRGQTSEDMINRIKETPDSPEIVYIKDYLTEEEMASLYRACDVFVSPYRGEGFSLPTLEAMASGLPVIVTEGGATEDFVLDSFAWKIPSYKVSIGTMINNDPLVGEAFLLEPDGDYLTNLMKAIYRNPADIVVRGIIASSYARTYWTWMRSTLKLLSRIDALYGKDLSKKAKNKLVDKIDAQILLGNAESYFSEGQLAEAFKIYQQIENKLDELDKKYKIFYYLRLAIIYILNKDFDTAFLHLKKVENLEKDHIDSLYLKSKILYLQNNSVEALEKYTELVSRWNAERFSSVLGNSLDQILVEMANIMMDMQDIENSLQLYTNALKLNERNVEAYIGAAKCFIAVKDFEEATRMLEWALKMEPENEEAKAILDEITVGS
ncbi:MAG: glycosyltransferase [Candidatus Kapaibacteriota bacterium]